ENPNAVAAAAHHRAVTIVALVVMDVAAEQHDVPAMQPGAVLARVVLDLEVAQCDERGARLPGANVDAVEHEILDHEVRAVEIDDVGIADDGEPSAVVDTAEKGGPRRRAVARDGRLTARRVWAAVHLDHVAGRQRRRYGATRLGGRA